MLNFRDHRRTAVILATGESAGKQSLELLKGWPVVAINDGIYLWPEAEHLYAADYRWWKVHHEKVRAVSKAHRWCPDRKAARDFDLRFIESERAPGLSRDPGRIRTGIIGNSGAQGLHLAFNFGARRFVLVGFDFQGSHFFGEHPKEIHITSPWSTLRAHMSELAADLSREGCEVLNCSDRSTLHFWPKRTLAEALPPG